MGNYTVKLVRSSSEPMLYRILWDTREDCPAGSQVGPEVRSLYLIECNFKRELGVSPNDYRK